MVKKNNLKILVTDDRDMTRKILRDFLINQGFEVLLAKNGQECIQVSLNEKPNLILLDLSIPVIDGWETARLIKANNATGSIPILAVTAHTLPGDREKAIAAGCDDYFPKPLNHEVLLKRIRELLHL